MMKGFFLSTSFLVGSVFTLVFSIFLFQYIQDKQHRFVFTQQNSQMFAALPNNPITQSQIKDKNVRVEVVENFFKAHNSPLIPHAELVVKTADKYGLDYRLIPAVAMQESNLCKKAPNDSHNCWGYGIYGSKVLTFDNYEQAIETVTRGLAENYKEQGLVTPREIMTKYTPSNTGKWALAVEYFMTQLNLF